MPVGAVIGAGVATAGATVIAGSSSASAINKSTAAQQQANQDSMAVQRDIFAQNKATLAPYVAAGQPATAQINSLLGLAGDDPASVDYSRFVDSTPNALAAFNAQGGGSYYNGWSPFGDAYGYSAPVLDKAAFGKQWAAQNNADLSAYTTPGQTAADKARAGFDLFRKSTGYDWRMKQGMNALNAGYAGRGVIRSGAAMKGAIDYGQNLASAEFGNHLNTLQAQQNLGAGAASAQAGVGQSFANNITNLNTANANALAQGAVASANNTSGMIGGLTNALNSTVAAIAYPKLFKAA